MFPTDGNTKTTLLILKSRLGFVRKAIEYGAPLVGER
jgi:hypothetical protein